jgi:hypothetical protein
MLRRVVLTTMMTTALIATETSAVSSLSQIPRRITILRPTSLMTALSLLHSVE